MRNYFESTQDWRKAEGIEYDLNHPYKQWRELIADAYYIGNSAYPHIGKKGEWKNWPKEKILYYFGKIIDKLRKMFFVIPERKNKSSWWKCYYEAKRKGFLKTVPPSEEERKEWDEKREEMFRKGKLKKKGIFFEKIFFSEKKGESKQNF